MAELEVARLEGCAGIFAGCEAPPVIVRIYLSTLGFSNIHFLIPAAHEYICSHPIRRRSRQPPTASLLVGGCNGLHGIP